MAAVDDFATCVTLRRQYKLDDGGAHKAARCDVQDGEYTYGLRERVDARGRPLAPLLLAKLTVTDGKIKRFEHWPTEWTTAHAVTGAKAQRSARITQIACPCCSAAIKVAPALAGAAAWTLRAYGGDGGEQFALVRDG